MHVSVYLSGCTLLQETINNNIHYIHKPNEQLTHVLKGNRYSYMPSCIILRAHKRPNAAVNKWKKKQMK